MATATARTVRLLRVLRAAGPLKKKRAPLPKQQQPDGLRRDYYKAILPFARQAAKAFARVKPEVLRQLADFRKEQQGKTDGARMDAMPASTKKLLAGAQAKAAKALDQTELFAVAEKFGTATTKFQREQLDKQVQAAISVPYSAIEKPTRDRVPAFAKENVDLIKTVPERYFGRIQDAVQAAYESGESVDTLIDRLQDIDDISDNDAARIARDQIGKLNGQVNADRQQALGATRFVWRTMNDERVRDEHAELEGETFDWDDPPEEGIPGEPIQCRCYAEPDFSDILGGVDE